MPFIKLLYTVWSCLLNNKENTIVALFGFLVLLNYFLLVIELLSFFGNLLSIWFGVSIFMPCPFCFCFCLLNLRISSTISTITSGSSISFSFSDTSLISFF